ncbi:MAG TPA: redoxin domain-containing protein [Symbiobacteriaceae bacterium]
MTCPQCNTSALPRARYCHQCGRELQTGVRPPFPPWKRRTMALLLGLASLLALGLLLIPRDGSGRLQVGDRAPDFDLVSLTGDRVRMANLEGKPLILNFWATWCGPCRREMPALADVYRRYRDQGLELFAINVGESPVAVEQFLRQVGVEVPVLLDRDDQAQEAYRILPLPTTFFIDRSGIIRAIYTQQMSGLQIEAEVLRLLSVDATEGESTWNLPTS